ncbi:hypothetical protein FIA58_018660 [Flavobacterium jejuense]|uniref:Phospholipase/carboxylesterase/thioesterase domain-containing protein n=1 Tax=Flavobacterium jejuense TaxID=1544455 RepID=A0ABX0IW71_9FLAO|nr:hypothetical protein [Flavobacterium jejuense]NHN27708.1 hypothetical protein [Flavobacterium jejuense]
MNDMNKTFLIIISIFSNICCSGQEFEKVIISEQDTSNLYVNDNDSTELYYLKLVPKLKPIGVVMVLPSGGETVQDLLKQIEIPHLAYDNNILTIIPSINWGTETREVEIEVLDKIIKEVVKAHNIPEENFVLGGLSNGGMISLTYAEISKKEKGSTFMIPKGVFGLDIPLDKAHMYQYCIREINRNFSEVGVNEARWIMNNYNQTYGGSPKEFPERYIEASIYSNGAEKGGNAQYLKDIPIRMYTDLDVEWLINQRRRDLYDWNGTDIVAMINDLKLMGNQDANVIITMGKGVRLDGRRHPHSWSIMDNQDCMNWIINLFENKK